MRLQSPSLSRERVPLQWWRNHSHWYVVAFLVVLAGATTAVTPRRVRVLQLCCARCGSTWTSLEISKLSKCIINVQEDIGLPLRAAISRVVLNSATPQEAQNAAFRHIEDRLQSRIRKEGASFANCDSIVLMGKVHMSNVGADLLGHNADSCVSNNLCVQDGSERGEILSERVDALGRMCDSATRSQVLQ